MSITLFTNKKRRMLRPPGSYGTCRAMMGTQYRPPKIMVNINCLVLLIEAGS